MNGFIITTTPILEGAQIETYLGVVNTNIVIGVNFFSDLAASFTDIFGGYSKTYQKKMDDMYESAKKNLMLKVKKMGGNAIVGFRIDFDEISGKGKGMFMLSAQGTACIVKARQNMLKDIVNTSNIDCEVLEKEMTKQDIMKDLNRSYHNLSDSDWTYILENPSLEIAKPLVDKQYYQYTQSIQQKVEILVSLLDFDDAISIVYPNYLTPREEYYNNENGISAKKDVSDLYLSIIKNCKLFDPVQVLRLMDIDLKKAIPLLTCEKSSYQIEDLNNMKLICEKLDNLPDVGQRILGKIGLFSKEREIWVCPKGHKNELSFNYCEDCFVNIKGFTSEEQSIINRFKSRTEALSNLMSR